MLGLFLAVQVFGALALQSAPALHAALHGPDAEQEHAEHGAAGHDCLVTLLQTGSVEATTPEGYVTPAEFTTFADCSCPSSPHLAPPAHWLAPGRAPPFCA